MSRPKGSKDKKPRMRTGNHKKIACTCSICGAPFTRKKVLNTDTICKKCRSEKNRNTFLENHPGYQFTEKEKARRRRYSLESKYGLSLVDYEEMLAKQGGVCAICKKAQYPENHRLCVDHDHISGKVRGLLCHKCNQAIGLLNDNATLAAQYLIANSKRSWDEYFMHIATLTASRSKDRSTKVGAVIVRNKIILSTGYNGFPRGVNDEIEERHQRPLKYSWVCHAEENAILNAARIGAKTKGSELYVTLYPCTTCTKAIIQSEITKVFYLSSDNPRWTDDFKLSQEMLKEVGISAVPVVI